MSSARRRTRTGIPVAVFVALFAAALSWRSSHRSAARPDASTSAGQQGVTAPATVSPSKTPGQPAGRRDPANSVGFSSRAHLVEHFKKHGAEFPGASVEIYLSAAQSLRDAPLGETVLEVRRRDGVVTRYDRSDGAFIAVNRDGTIRTFFRPNDGEAYFRRQASRTPGGGS